MNAKTLLLAATVTLGAAGIADAAVTACKATPAVHRVVVHHKVHRAVLAGEPPAVASVDRTAAVERQTPATPVRYAPPPVYYHAPPPPPPPAYGYVGYYPGYADGYGYPYYVRGPWIGYGPRFYGHWGGGFHHR